MQYRFKKSTCALMLVLAVGCSTLQAKTSAKSQKPVATKSAEQTKLVIEPEAIAALEQMSSYLRTLKTFTVNTQTDRIREKHALILGDSWRRAVMSSLKLMRMGVSERTPTYHANVGGCC